MYRRAFIRRMIFAGLATWFVDLPLPGERPNCIVRWTLPTGEWFQVESLILNATIHADSAALPEGVTLSFEPQRSPGPMTWCWTRTRTSFAPHLARTA